MKLLKYCIIAVVCLVGASSLFGQTFPARERIHLTVDLCRYRGGDDENTQVEMAYAFSERSLTYKSDSAGISSAMDLTVIVSRKDSVVAAERWLVPHTIQDTAALSRDMNLVGLYTVQLTEGEYTFRVIGRDRNDMLRRDSIVVRLPIRKHGSLEPVLSDVELASTIRPGSKGGMFYKNTLDVVPNVGGLYIEDQKVFLYAEAYNLLAGHDTSAFSIKTGVYDAVGKEVVARERQRRRAGESTVIVDQFPVNTLRTGTYSLVLSIADSSKKILTSSGRRFFVYNQTLGIDSTLIASSSTLPMPQYMSMDESELDREFDWSRYCAVDDEKSQYSKLGKSKDGKTPEEVKGIVESKKKFMSDFWRHREPGLREEYLARVAYSNANFRIMAREGFRTDRGRVHIVYGPPDDVERHPNETETRPYEIWSYNNIQGGVLFVFVLRNSAGDYELVHSTHRNELQDENWDRVGITR
jgi:GWxTD domain-containing protein